MLEKVADPFEFIDVVSLQAYAAIARSHVMSRLAREAPVDAQTISGLEPNTYTEAVKFLKKANHVLEDKGALVPLGANGDEYLKKARLGGYEPSTASPYIQIADNLFRRRKQAKGEKTLPAVFPLLSPEQFYLMCLLVQGVRLPAFLGVSPDYISWKDDKPTPAIHITRMLKYADVQSEPSALLASLLEGDTTVFKIIEVPMQQIDDYTGTLTFVPPWDRRNSDNQPEEGWGVGASRHKHPKNNELIRVLLPIVGYEVSYKRDAPFFGAMTLMPDKYTTLKTTLNTYYGSKNREHWQRYADSMFEGVTVDELLGAIQPYE
jgi:hypothetical protein